MPRLHDRVWMDGPRQVLLVTSQDRPLCWVPGPQVAEHSVHSAHGDQPSSPSAGGNTTAHQTSPGTAPHSRAQPWGPSWMPQMGAGRGQTPGPPHVCARVGAQGLPSQERGSRGMHEELGQKPSVYRQERGLRMFLTASQRRALNPACTRFRWSC